MPCKRCSTCSINFPVTGTPVCKLCGGQVWWDGDRPPDSDWRERVEEIGGPVIVAAEPLPMVHRDRVRKLAGQAWISDEDLAACLYPDPQVDDIIRVEGRKGDIFFELEGRIPRDSPSWGKIEGKSGWWIRRIDWAGWAPDFPPEA